MFLCVTYSVHHVWVKQTGCLILKEQNRITWKDKIILGPMYISKIYYNKSKLIKY